MLSQTIEKALNNQIAAEAESSFYYLAMASWCDKSALPGCAKFFYAHAEEERTHMLKLFTYISAAGSHAIVPAVKQPPLEYKSIANAFEGALKHEREVTGSINKLVELSFKEKDFATFNFLQWFVAEQHEEEYLFTSVIDKIKQIGNDSKAIYWVDREVAALERK